MIRTNSIAVLCQTATVTALATQAAASDLTLMDQVGGIGGSDVDTQSIPYACQIFEPELPFDIAAVDDFVVSFPVELTSASVVISGYDSYNDFSFVQGVELSVWDSLDAAGSNLQGDRIHVEYSQFEFFPDPTWGGASPSVLITLPVENTMPLAAGRYFMAIIPINEFGLNGRTGICSSSLGDGYAWQANPTGNFGFGPSRSIEANLAYAVQATAYDNDCNDNGIADETDIGNDPSIDCDGNGLIDECEVSWQVGDAQSIDCDSNGFIDSCEFEWGVAADCNDNGIIDSCDIDSGSSKDCDGYGVPDECEDCNGNGEGDPCDLADGTSEDCNGNGIPDECDIADGDDSDCNGNGIPDSCDLDNGGSTDCNGNDIPDECDIADGTTVDCDTNGIPDECESQVDCNANGVFDICDINEGTSLDCNGNDVPDECESQADCNTNGVFDSCDINDGTSLDCNDNGIPDECDADDGTSLDCNANSIPDECEVASTDCNANGIPDDCDIANGTSEDSDGNGIPDECPLPCWTLENDLGYEGISESGNAIGIDIAISDDIAVVLAASEESGSFFERYYLHFFHRENGQWTHEATELFDDEYSSLYYPRKSLDISGDTVIAGSTTGEGGRFAIFRRQGGQWIKEAAVDEEGHWYFGLAVSISGNVAVVGPGVDTAGARVYRRFGSTWVHEITLEQTLGEADEWFGSDVAIDDSTIIVGTLNGHGWIFEHDGQTWNEAQYLPGEDMQLGPGVDLDGDVAVIGRNHDTNVNAAVVYRRNNGTWAAEQALESQDPATEGLGYVVRTNGDLVAVSSGMNYDNKGGAPQGKIHLFRFDGNQWNEIDIFERPDLPTGWLMSPRVSLSGNQVAAGFNQEWLFTEVTVFTVPPADSPGQDDCNINGICDELDLVSGVSLDCDGNGVPDSCDIADGLYLDVDLDGTPDACEADCNGNGWPDDYELEQGLALDCNANDVLDSCDIASGHSPDSNGNDVPDECESDFVITVATDGSGLFDDIQSALDFSAPGSTIRVAAGVYLGPIILPSHQVELLSHAGPEETFILGDTNVTALRIVDQQGRDTVVDGFSLVNADVTWHGGGLYIARAAPTIRNCDIADNRASRGGGVYVSYGGPRFENCRIGTNQSEYGGGGGIAIDGIHDSNTPVELSNCLISSNIAHHESWTWSGGGGGLAAESNAIVHVQDTRFEYNQAVVGGAFSVNEPSEYDLLHIVTFEQCEFADNIGTWSNAVGSIRNVYTPSLVSLEDCTLCGHDFSEIGGNWQDLGGNEASDTCSCPGDTNGDGVVDVNDILAVLESWGDCPPEDDCPGDVNFDGTVNVNDVLLVISEWGLCE